MSLTDVDPRRSDSERIMALISYGLLFSAVFFAGVPALVAVILAYTQRRTAGAAVRDHFRFQIQIFWIGFLLALIAGICGLWALIEASSDAWRNGGVHADLAESDLHLTGRIIGLFIGCGVSLALLTLWSLAAPAVGFIRLLTAPRPAALA